MVYSIIQKSQLEAAHRMDAEYFATNLVFKDYYLGEQVVKFTQYGTSDDLNEDRVGYPTLRLNEFDSYFVKEPGKYCSTINDQEFHNLQLKEGDVLVCRTNGNPKLVGKSAIVMENKPYAFASYLFRVRPDIEKINSSTLVTYLHTIYGKGEIEKNMMISNQTNFSPARFGLIRIPKFNKNLQKTIDSLFRNSYKSSNESKSFYKQAEDLLLEELGLKNAVFEDELSSVVNYSDVISNNRIDPEYFQPKYQKLIEKIKGKNAKTLGELVSIRKGFEPGSEAYQEEGKLFIRVSSVSKLGIEETDQKYLSEELYQELKKDYKPKLGDILLTKDATPGIAYVIKEPLEGIISGGILDLKIKDNIESEYLALCISSIVGQWQAQRDAGGSIIAHWKPEQVKNLIIPILPVELQKQIAELVVKSHEAREKSKELLDQAKREVEEMIEKQAN